MKKYLFIVLLLGVCFADIVVLKNGESFNGLVIGIKENSILFKSKNNGYIFLRTETIDHLGLSSGEIIIKDNSLNISTPQKQKFLEKYEENYLNIEPCSSPYRMFAAPHCSPPHCFQQPLLTVQVVLSLD